VIDGVGFDKKILMERYEGVTDLKARIARDVFQARNFAHQVFAVIEEPAREVFGVLVIAVGVQHYIAPYNFFCVGQVVNTGQVYNGL
jgi:hypothetical protein